MKEDKGANKISKQEFQQIRARWEEYVTGNSYWAEHDSDGKYAFLFEGYDSRCEEARMHLALGNPETLFDDLRVKMEDEKEAYEIVGQLGLTVTRVNNMAKAWASVGSRYYHDASLADHIIYSMEWIHANIFHEKLDNKTRFGNWWNWWIGMPRELASASILMYDVLNTPKNSGLLQGIIATLKHFNEDPGMFYRTDGSRGELDAANLADTCKVAVLRGCLADDSEGLVLADKYFDKIIQIVDCENGIYDDGSFIQHENLAYTGAYGSVLLNSTASIVYLLAGSRWEPEETRLHTLLEWIWNGIRPLCADGAFFMGLAGGRSISRPEMNDMIAMKDMLVPIVLLADGVSKEWKEKLLPFVKHQLLAGKAKTGSQNYYNGMSPGGVVYLKKLAEDEGTFAKKEPPYAKIFGAMDKAVAHGEHFSVGFNIASKRMGLFEYGNYENSKAWHQADGVLYLFCGDAGRYSDNYWNTVDEQRLPGITTDKSIWELENWGKYTGNTDYVGGAALDRYAAVAMDFKNYSAADNPDLSAKKAWFVFEKEIVCLGTGIRGCNSGKDTETIVENKMVKGGNLLLVNGRPYAADDSAEGLESNVTWAWLEGNEKSDHIGYYFPCANDVYVKREARTGSWSQINQNFHIKNIPVTRKYVSLALKHKAQAHMAEEYGTYAYVLLPGMTAQQTEAYSANSDITILANNEAVQAVCDKEKNVCSYIFWEAAAKAEKPVRVGDIASECAAVIVKKDPKGRRIALSIAEPSQTRDQIVVCLYGKGLELIQKSENITVTQKDENSVVLTVAVKDKKGAAFQAVFNYEESALV